MPTLSSFEGPTGEIAGLLMTNPWRRRISEDRIKSISPSFMVYLLMWYGVELILIWCVCDVHDGWWLYCTETRSEMRVDAAWYRRWWKVERSLMCRHRYSQTSQHRRHHVSQSNTLEFGISKQNWDVRTVSVTAAIRISDGSSDIQYQFIVKQRSEMFFSSQLLLLSDRHIKDQECKNRSQERKESQPCRKSLPLLRNWISN